MHKDPILRGLGEVIGRLPYTPKFSKVKALFVVVVIVKSFEKH